MMQKWSRFQSAWALKTSKAVATFAATQKSLRFYGNLKPAFVKPELKFRERISELVGRQVQLLAALVGNRLKLLLELFRDGGCLQGAVDPMNRNNGKCAGGR